MYSISVLIGEYQMKKLYELTSASNPAASFDAGNELASVSVKGIVIVSDKSKSNYQLVSKEIDVRKDKHYCLKFDIELVKGCMALGVLDSKNDQWITQYPLMLGKHELQTIEFVALSERCKIILQTDNPKPDLSTAYLRALVLEEIPRT